MTWNHDLDPQVRFHFVYWRVLAAVYASDEPNSHQ